MGNRLGLAVRRLWTFFRLALGWLFSLPKRLIQRIQGAIIRIWEGMVNGVTALWAFVGRCGLALRNLLSTLIWPLRWIYRRVLYRPLHFTVLSLKTFAGWFFADLIWGGVKVLFRWPRAIGRRISWMATTLFYRIERIIPGRRARIEERLIDYGSRQMPGKRSVRLTAALEPVSSRVRFSRFTTAVVTTGILLILGVMTTQGRPAGDASAVDLGTPIRPAVAALVPKMTLTSTATPTVTPEPTPLPTITPTAATDLSPWPTPDPLGGSGTILFSARDNGNSDIYALTIGRPDPIRLTTHQADDRSPAWSPDGQRLAFTSHRDGNWEIYILELPTGELQRLTDNPGFDGDPSWSPDGQWLVYTSYRDPNMDLFIIDATGEDPAIRVTEHEALDFAPSWSPDGRHIAYTSWRSGNQDIFIMSLDTASDEAAVNVSLSPDRDEDQAVFDQEGSHLAYHSHGDGLDLIYAQRLANYRPDGPAFSLGRGYHPSWSPDGTSLAFVTNKESRSYIIAGAIDSWAVAPQAYSRSGNVRDLAWSGMLFPRGVERRYSTDEGKIEPLYVEQVDLPQEFGPSFMLREIDVEAPSPYLSDKVDDSFIALRERVLEEVGWDFLGHVDNMFSFLASKPFPGEPESSWNKAARAFDFYFRYPISIEPQVEIVRENKGVDTYWRVYLRAADQSGARGEPLRQQPWDFTARYDADPRYYDQGGKEKDAIPPGYYVDFTELAADYGWSRTAALANWRTYFQGIRYWHFENQQDLAWEEAILELYTADELEQAYGNR